MVKNFIESGLLVTLDILQFIFSVSKYLVEMLSIIIYMPNSICWGFTCC